jgi:cellulose synthase/poly-beta-1,6-N-acetylglucosamine synthase-like glycosyltransferase
MFCKLLQKRSAADMDDPVSITLMTIFILAVYPYAGYPVLLALIGRIFGNPLNPPQGDPRLPTCSIVIAVHNGAAVIGRKLANTLQLTYPKELLQVIVVCDGCSDATEQIVREHANSRIKIISLPRCGKNSALNVAVAQCRSELLIFSDCDAILVPDALLLLIRWFENPSVGGVVGRKNIAALSSGLTEAQKTYLGMQDRLRALESRLHSSATNEGKLHAIRRSCWQELPLQGCDDFLILLNVVACKKRFIFEPRAIAEIPAPSADMQVEVARRRRIVKRSMFALWHYRALFNPFRSGWFSFMLWSHKLGRRLSPLSMLLFVMLGVVQAFRMRPVYFTSTLIVLVTTACILFGAIMLWRRQRSSASARTFRLPLIGKLAYFMSGNWGTIRGITDFIFGRGNAVYWSSSRYTDPDNKGTSV